MTIERFHSLVKVLSRKYLSIGQVLFAIFSIFSIFVKITEKAANDEGQDSLATHT